MSINTITLDRQGDLPAIFEACARHRVAAVCPWRHQVHQAGLERAAKLLRDAGLNLSGYCRGGMMVADKAHRQSARDDNRRAVEEAVTLGAPSLVLVVGGLPQFSRPGSAPSKDIAAARDMVAEEIAHLLEFALPAKMPLAIEPLHPMHAAERGCINTLRQALDLCDRLDPARDRGLGVAVDVYHCWWDPELATQIARAGAARLMAFHVCDWLVPTTHLLTDRGMMGDGIVDIALIRGWMEAAGYGGHAEVEIFSERWWREPMDKVLETCVERHKRVV
ncbi:sugar phosphate isomerase/epimerase family protein [Hypericibacter sp.]|uniref:sugar phosphate isomerase/epimerase family protein n=1 Tax=Hypericibacter sp. TaxID=2705401 RepID=UPI003D6D98A9